MVLNNAKLSTWENNIITGHRKGYPGGVKEHDLSALTLRPARPEDGPELNRVCYPHYSAAEMTRSLATSFMQAQKNLGIRLVAELEKQIVGCGQVISWRANAEIADVVVAARHRNKGIGRLLIQRLIKEANLLGYPTVEIGVEAANEIALALYQKVGFIYQRTVSVTWQGKESVYIYLERKLTQGLI